MKQTIVAVTMLLGCIGLAGLAKSETVNDRYYVAGASPSVVAPGSTSTYNVSVTNDLKSGPSHFVRQVIVTVPTGFTLITSPGASSPVTPPSGWNLQSISGQTITVVTMSSTMTAGKSVTIRITAQAPAISGGCAATQSYPWQLNVNQDINGGVGNTYGLRSGTDAPIVVVASPDCVAPTNLVLNSISPASLITTNTGTAVTITATLTSATSVPIPNEPVTFTVGGDPITCSPAITNASGIAICSYVPQELPNTPLTAGPYDVFANFAGDKVPNPAWGSSMSLAEQLTVNTDGTALSVADAGGPFNGTVNLTATLTTGNNQLPLSGKTITLSVNGVVVGSPQQTNNAGVVSVSNVSLAGIPIGSYPQFISASFAGDGTYSATSNSATLAVWQLPASILWTSPAMDFIYGTALSAAQLNATAALPGIFVYTPAAGTVLNAGSGQPLSVTFTPNDHTDYNAVTATVYINVRKATPAISVAPYSVVYDGNAHTATGQAVGVGGVSLSSLNLSGTTHTSPGDYPADSWTFTDASGNYIDVGGTVHDVISNAPSPSPTPSPSPAPSPSPSPSPSAPTIFVGGVVNAASFIAGPVAPGSLVAIFGTNLASTTASATSFPLPTSLGNTSIMLNGILMPLLYVSPTQVNAQVPFEISTGTMSIVAISNDTTSLPAAVEISGTDPGIFLLPGAHAAARNLDSSVNSSLNPVRAGSYVTVYFTGQGAFDKPIADGAPAPMTPLSWTLADTAATVGGINALVSYSGATPMLAGLSQVNLVVPAGLAPGDYPVTITVGAVTSNSGTVSITQ